MAKTSSAEVASGNTPLVTVLGQNVAWLQGRKPVLHPGNLVRVIVRKHRNRRIRDPVIERHPGTQASHWPNVIR